MSAPRATSTSLAISVLAIIALGLVANITVAWALSAASPWEARGVADGRAWHNGSGFVKVFWFSRAGAQDVLVAHQETWPEHDLLASASVPPRWFPLEGALSPAIELDSNMHRVASIARARGWPLLSFQDEGSLVPETAAPQFARPLPLRPIWRGFLANSIFYCGVFAILHICARVVRRAAGKRKAQATAATHTATGAGMCGCGA